MEDTVAALGNLATFLILLPFVYGCQGGGGALGSLFGALGGSAAALLGGSGMV